MKKILTGIALSSVTVLAMNSQGLALTYNAVVNVSNASTVEDVRPVINQAGDMAWESECAIKFVPASGTPATYSAAGKCFQYPRINSSGDLTWQAFDSATSRNQIYLKKVAGTATVVSDTQYDSHSPDINDSAQLVWLRDNTLDHEVVYHNGTAIVWATSTESDNNLNPHISDNGDITWQGTDGEPDYEIFRRSAAGVVEKVHINNTYDDTDPRINSTGAIVWVANISAGNGDIDKRNADGTIEQVGSDPTSDDRNPVISDNGAVAWTAFSGTSNADIFYAAQGSAPVNLTPTDYTSDYLPSINKLGDVAFLRYVTASSASLVIYDISAGNSNVVGTLNTALTLEDGNLMLSDAGTVVWQNWNNTNTEIFKVSRNLNADSDGDTYPGSADCDDGVAAINPGAAEVCGDGIDNNCNGQADEGCSAVCGNGLVEGLEQCDDGNTIDGDHCTSICKLPPVINYTGGRLTTSNRDKFAIQTNGRGDKVWTERMGWADPNNPTDDRDAEIFYYDKARNQIYQLTDNFYYDRTPVLAENGDVAWVQFDGTSDSEIYVFKYDNRDGNGNPINTPITYGTDSYQDSLVRINNSGEITWVSIRSGKKQVMYRDYRTAGATNKQITNNFNNSLVDINDNGYIVWQQSPTGVGTANEDAEIMLVSGRDATPTPMMITNNVYDDTLPDINNNEVMVWYQKIGANQNNFEIMRQSLTAHNQALLPERMTNDNFMDSNPHINDDGDIVYEKTEGTDVEIYAFLSASQVHVQITNNTQDDLDARIANSGDIIWLREYDDPNTGVLLYTEIFTYDLKTGGSGQLTNNGFESFTPAIASTWDAGNSVWQVTAAWGSWDTSTTQFQVYTGDKVSCTDNDGDGFTVCDGDCNDNDPTIKPNAIELCDNKDNDCNGQIDDGIMVTYYYDSDNDGFGDNAISEMSCSGPSAGYVPAGNDCDDANANINPGAVELCEAYGNTHVDDNCDGLTFDPAAGYTNWYYDTDLDGYGDPNTLGQPAISNECSGVPAGYVDGAPGADCDETNVNINPGAAEIIGDGIDNNCNGLVDETGTPMPVELLSTGGAYDTVQSAYAVAGTTDTIMMQATEIIAPVDLNRSITVTLAGGYNDTYTSRVGWTILSPPASYVAGPTVNIRNGKVIVDTVIIR